MKTEIYKCNQCGNISNDYYNEYGWIHINSNGLTITNGRRNDGVATAISYVEEIKLVNSSQSLDFCCLRCFLKYLYQNKKTNNFKEQDRDFTQPAYCAFNRFMRYEAEYQLENNAKDNENNIIKSTIEAIKILNKEKQNE